MKKFKWVLGGFFVIAILSLGISFPWLTNREKVIVLDSVVDVAKTIEGEYYIVDKGGFRVLKLDSSLAVTQILKMEEKIKQIVANRQGQVFIRTVRLSGQNNSIDREGIYEIHQKTGRLKVWYEEEYETNLLRSRLVQISGLSKGLRFAAKGEEEITFFEAVEPNDVQQLLRIPVKEAEAYVCSAILNQEGDTAYYCLQDGRIFAYYRNTKEDKEIFNGALRKEREGIPRFLSLNPEGTLNFVDIGLRDIGKIQDGSLTFLFGNYALEKEEFIKQKTPISVDAEGDLVANSSYGVYLNLGEGTKVFHEFELGAAQWFLTIFSKFGAIVSVISGLVLLYGLGKKYLKKDQGIGKIMLALCGVIGIVTFMFLVMIIPDYKAQMVAELEQRTENVAYLVSGSIAIDSLKKLDSVADFRKEDYWKIKEVIDHIFLAKEGVNDFYCTIYTIRDDIVMINYSSEESNGSVYPYDWVYEGSDEKKIMETQQRKVYTSWTNSEGNYTFSLSPIIDENGESVGLIEVGVNTQSFNEHMNALILDMLITVLAIAAVIIFLLLEVLVFAQGRKELIEKEKRFIPNKILRSLVFLIFLVTNLSTSFLPLYALELSQNAPQIIPRELWASLVISAEVFAGALLSLKGYIVIDYLGQRRGVIVSAIVMIVGMVLRPVPHIGFLLIGQLLMGAGWGVILLVVNTQISMNEEEKDEGFAGYSAAAFNGINSGVVLGGFAIKFMTYRTVIALAAVLSIFILLHVNKYMREASVVSIEEGEEQQLSTFAFLLKRRVWSFLLLLVFPVIACGYYLNYMYPILSENLGIQGSYIGYSYLINGLVVLAFGNILTGYISKWIGKKAGLVLSAFIYAGVFVMLSFSTQMLPLFLSLALLGLADSFGLPLHSSYFMDLEESKQYGYDRAAGIYSLVENLAQSLGPIIFGYILILGLEKGLQVLGITLVVFAVLFFAINFFEKKKTL